MHPLAEPRPTNVDAIVKQLLDAPSQTFAFAGLAGSAGVYLATALVSRLRRSVWYVVKDSDVAHAARADACFYAEHIPSTSKEQGPPIGEPLLILPSEDPPWASVHPDRTAIMKRLSALAKLCHEPSPRLVIVSAAALKRRVVAPDYLRSHCRTLRVGDTVDLSALSAQLVDAGYLRVPLVEDPGTLGVRGGLLDVWPAYVEQPYRVELVGDKVSRIRAFDSENQRTREDVLECFIPPCTEGVLDASGRKQLTRRVAELADVINYPSNQTKRLIEELLGGRPFFGSGGYAPAFGDWVTLLEYLPESAPLFIEEAPSVRAAFREEDEILRKSEESALALPHFPFEAWALTDEQLAERLRSRAVISLLRFAQLGQNENTPLDFIEQTPEDPESLSSSDHQSLSITLSSSRKLSGAASALEPLLVALKDWSANGFLVSLVARTRTQLERLRQLLEHRGVLVELSRNARTSAKTETAVVRLETGVLARGVVLPYEMRVYLTEEEIFGERSHRHKKAERRTENSLEDLRSLSPGDYVVHQEHGIGKYLGLERRELGASFVELIVIEYLAGKLYLPIYRLNQIAKYSGGEAAPKLDRLGGLSFAKTKARVQKRVRQMADELLRLYSERLVLERPPLPPRDDDFSAFEATFPFEETRDQAAAIVDVLDDLESKKVMDRLVCGDVGFGKTEVALRAAYRVASQGRQVALLCPTTVLAQQHANQFKNRLGDFGLEVRGMSRFTKAAEAKDTLLGLKRGTVDVVIGTHRLLSKDIDFKELGLLIIDEEQRFGVSHKERIKQLRGTVDVLTLSATPIPRTLQMAVGGLRDLSMISTPPVDRRSIRTLIAKAEEPILLDAISRELNRGGQVFYVYNRVAGLEERAAKLSQLFPGVPLSIAHGQMGEDKLEKAMMRFVSNEAKILVCTAIIENGLDIPRANTLIVDRADLFGLSQLYQLRGRVGRSKERAYCYLLVPSLSELTEEARNRLEAIERFSELGSGLKVAALDLELRGAGDFLGGEQSGFVSSVGFELFCHMLRDAADEARGQPVRHDVEPELSFDVETLLPEDYISDVGIRLSLYKQLALARDTNEVDELAWGMEDRFGPAPIEAQQLVQLMRSKTVLRKLAVLSCEATVEQVRLRVREDTPLDPFRVGRMVSDPEQGYRLLPDGTLVAKRRKNETVRTGLDLLDRLLEELVTLTAANH
jgi:transcription-repair coupling factor (superfamily II helicase)